MPQNKTGETTKETQGAEEKRRDHDVPQVPLTLNQQKNDNVMQKINK